MKGQMDRFLTLEEHMDLGVTIAWLPGFTHHVTWAALYDFMNEFQERGIAAWDDFQESRKNKPYPNPLRWPDNEDLDKQQELEKKYFSEEMLEKYKRSTGGSGSAT